MKWMSVIIDTEDYTREKFDRSGVFHPIFLFTREKGYLCVGLFWENESLKGQVTHQTIVWDWVISCSYVSQNPGD